MIVLEEPTKNRLPFSPKGMTSYQLKYVEVMINNFANKKQLELLSKHIKYKLK